MVDKDKIPLAKRKDLFSDKVAEIKARTSFTCDVAELIDKGMSQYRLEIAVIKEILDMYVNEMKNS